ncbi:MAG: sodium:calcium symporter, partial [Candidatus Omnitrophica bacterium CG11_big_fil_rev_8_21_14_0_20_42_13]
ISFFLCQPVIFLLGHGVVNEMDFWGGTFCLVVFATVETILFGWVFGIENAWEEMHKGADIKIPAIYKFIIKYITPSFLFLILGFWFVQEGVPTILMRGVAEADRIYILAIRLLLLGIFITLSILVKIAWTKKRKAKKR